MKKLIILLMFFTSCSLFYTSAQKEKYEREQMRIENCTKNIKIIDSSNTKPYEIINVVSTKYRNGSDNYAIEYLKYLACESGSADAITFPEMASGPIHTTYTSKVVLFKNNTSKTYNEGKLVGLVKSVNKADNEIIVSSAVIGNLVKIGDTLYFVFNGEKIEMEVVYPMQTIAKCKLFDESNISKLKIGDTVYK